MSSDSANIKAEPPEDMDEEDVEPPAFGPAALGLHRVGTKLPPRPAPTQPIQVLNARGMPARIRKKNKLFFDDDIVNDKPLRTSPKRTLKMSPVKTPTRIMKKRKIIQQKLIKSIKPERQESPERTAPSLPVQQILDKRIGQKIGMRLRNLLKLPKAHKFVSYEWFYSNIDRPLFEGDNDFQICLNETFPELKTRRLSRVEWTKIRRMMGKPRRCSQSFFQEERRELERKRQKIRLLQSRKTGDTSFVKDLPNEIPVPLSVGSIVTARLRRPQDGLFTGTVDALDSVTHTYRITFDRPGIGTHSVPDYEVLSNEPPDTIPLSSITQDFRPNINATCYVASPLRNMNPSASGLSSINRSDPLLGSEIYNNAKGKSLALPKDRIGGFPLKLLELIVRTKKTLSAKESKLQRLRDMNAEAEVCKSYGDQTPEDYQRRYASIVISMEKLNRDMQDYLNHTQQYCRDLTHEPPITAMLTPSYLREKCREMGVESVNKNNEAVKDERMVRLISDLAMIMWVASNLDDNDQYMHVLKVLEGCMEEVKNRLDPDNVNCFQKSVQIHMHHIKLGLGQISSSSSTTATEISDQPSTSLILKNELN